LRSMVALVGIGLGVFQVGERIGGLHLPVAAERLVNAVCSPRSFLISVLAEPKRR
jgi:hypothetical protein